MITKKDVVDKCFEYAQILQMALSLKKDDSETSVISIGESLELIITEFDTHIFILSSVTAFIGTKKINMSGPIYTVFKNVEEGNENNISTHEFGAIIIYYQNFMNWINNLHGILQQSQEFGMPRSKIEKIIKTLLNEKTIFTNSTIN